MNTKYQSTRVGVKKVIISQGFPRSTDDIHTAAPLMRTAKMLYLLCKLSTRSFVDNQIWIYKRLCILYQYFYYYQLVLYQGRNMYAYTTSSYISWIYSTHTLVVHLRGYACRTGTVSIPNRKPGTFRAMTFLHQLAYVTIIDEFSCYFCTSSYQLVVVLQAGLSPLKIPGFGDLQQRYTSSYAYYSIMHTQ